jgi:hypothetical protein
MVNTTTCGNMVVFVQDIFREKSDYSRKRDSKAMN